MRRLKVVGILLAAGLALIACGGEGNFEDHTSSAVQTPLIDGFVSRQSEAEVVGKLRRTNAKLSVIEDSNSEGSASRPQLSIRVLSVADFTYLGEQGDLRLQFVNDSLGATWFFPDDPAGFQTEVAKRWPAIADGRSLHLPVATELRTAMDFRGKKYWAWEDVNIRRQLRRWIKENA
jgi:hypothetical protein